MSKAKANLSVTRVSSGGVDGEDVADRNESSSYRAISMLAATSCPSEDAIKCLGGTTTVGPIVWRRSLEVASIELSRRKGTLCGTTRVEGDMIVVDTI